MANGDTLPSRVGQVNSAGGTNELFLKSSQLRALLPLPTTLLGLTSRTQVTVT